MNVRKKNKTTMSIYGRLYLKYNINDLYILIILNTVQIRVIRWALILSIGLYYKMQAYNYSIIFFGVY